MTPLLKNLILALVLAIIIWLGYVLFFRNQEATVSEDTVELNEAIVDGQQFHARLKQLQLVKLEGAVLADPRFQSLIDLRAEVTPEPVGRDNPFLPPSGRTIAE